MMYIQLQNGKRYIWRYKEFAERLWNIFGISLSIFLYLLVAYIEYEM